MTRLTSRDEDASQSATYSLSNDDSGRFKVDSQGRLYTAKNINHETQKRHVIRAMVTDNGNPPMKVSLPVIAIIIFDWCQGLYVIADNCLRIIICSCTIEKKVLMLTMRCASAVFFFATSLPGSLGTRLCKMCKIIELSLHIKSFFF